jgi:hypothetical protein
MRRPRFSRRRSAASGDLLWKSEMRLRRDKRGDAVGRSGRESSLSGVPGAKFFCEKPGIGTKMKNSLNFVSTVSKSLTRAVAALFDFWLFESQIVHFLECRIESFTYVPVRRALNQSATATCRTPPWLASGWKYPGQSLSQTSELKSVRRSRDESFSRVHS